MNRSMKKTVVLLLAAAMITVSLSAGVYAEESMLYKKEPTAGAMVADFVLVRPFAILGLGVSTLAFGLSYPFAAWGNNADQAKEKMVVDPYEYAFKRPLGDF